MGLSKTLYFTDKQNQMANIAKAMGHPARIAILEYLLSVDTCICGDIVSELPLAQPTISQHLKALKEADLIKGTIDGNALCYCINENTLNLLKSFIGEMEKKVISQKGNCC